MDKDRIEAYICRLIEEQRQFECSVDTLKNNKAQGQLEAALGTDLPEEGDDLDGLMKIHEELTNVQVNWSHANFLAFFPSRMADPSKSAGWLSSLHSGYNDSLAKHPEADRLERGVAEELRVLFGLSDGFSWSHVGGRLI
jgi:hypothetical protein